MKRWAHLILVIVLLWIAFVVRVHAITGQEPFIDEGYHVHRALKVWHFESHPAQESHGKFLLYFWIGLFDPRPVTGLYTARTSMAIFSLVSAAAVYGVGRQLANRKVGATALAVYAVLPLAVFFERMALADSFAGGFATLLAWRSLVFARRPNRREGSLIGLLTALALMAKLTMGLMPLLPVTATVLFYAWPQGKMAALRGWMRRYLPSGLVAIAVMAACWFPILIPAVRVAGTDEAFVLVNDHNLRQLDESSTRLDEVGTVASEIAGFTSWALLVVSAAALIYLIGFDSGTWRNAIFLLVWLALIVALPLIASNGIRSRYMMPTAMPLSVVVGYAAWRMWDKRQAVFKAAVLLSGAAWLVFFALPLNYNMWTDANNLPLRRSDVERYFSGNFGGEAIQQAVTLLEQIRQPSEPIYASHGTCQALYFYTTLPVQCLNDFARPEELRHFQTSYLVYNGHEWMTKYQPDEIPFPADELGLKLELLDIFERTAIKRNVRVWRVVSQK